MKENGKNLHHKNCESYIKREKDKHCVFGKRTSAITKITT